MFFEVKDLNKKYHHQEIIHRLSFAIDKGEILIVLGPSGCGKSTLLSCINGFEKVNGGQILLEQQDITTLPPEERNVSTVFQTYSLFPNMTVRQNLAYGLKFQKLGKSQRDQLVNKMISLLQLESIADMSVTEISGGQQQRVALGRSLIIRPKLLLLDEPFSNLDANLRLRLRRELRRVQQQLKMTMIFVTHDQQEAFALGDKILLINDGRLQQLATGTEIYDEPANQFVLKFVGTVNWLGQSRYLRPENITLTPDPHGEGIITQAVFQGPTIDYQVNLHRHTYQVTCLNRGHRFNVNERVTISYHEKELGKEL
ncbi:ABC transporter ATP-binding protein [Limosilactobacillus antri]|uniref:ABC-type quaternary amine transporter n=1 Tax=Limosilactobacillus antri DSM 16041 TaxID=525309 RepID=C8P5M5_9LACO|nr:ABC transporter ATP-binding protein [Limosilactobacillus antri]EEW54196.1 ABC transporter, ATP-binding protein [Limosilactobacillus antri DSM 16041]KRK60018.1 ABC superfamily ATP binding cassette transporter, ABC protein [Limosilactobacillus antri DSM 16041]